jgi:hypothetical protein
LIRIVDELLQKGEKWSVIENKSGRLEIIPTKSLENLNVKIIHKNE